MLLRASHCIQVEDRRACIQKGCKKGANGMQKGCRGEAKGGQMECKKGTKRMQLYDYDPGAALVCPETRAIFIADALSTGNAAHAAAAIGVAIEAFGIVPMAQHTQIPVAELRELFSNQGNPDLARLMRVLKVLEVDLSAVPCPS